MPDPAILKIVGLSAAALLAGLWLVVSFLPQGRARGRAAWLGATSLYVALSCLFLHLVRSAWESGSLLPLVAFGFLLFVFLVGLCLSLVRLLREFRSGGGADAHATH